MGFSVVHTVLAPAGNLDLTTLAAVHTELSIPSSDTSKDAFLTQAIGQVSGSIRRYCKRAFAPQQYQDAFDIQQDPYPYQTPGGFAQLQLTAWPVLEVASVIQLITPGTVPTLQVLNPGTDYRLNGKTGELLRLNPYTGVGTTWEAIPVTVVYTAGFGATVVETNAVPAVSPYTVTVQQAADFSCDMGVAYASGAALAPVAGAPAVGQYAVDPATGTYTFSAGDQSQLLTFGYATYEQPDDLNEICLRLITARYRGKDRDPNLMQQDTPQIGTQRFWIGGTPGQKGPFSPDIAAALDDYRVPTLA